jgi:hypothetical protein
MYYVAKTNELKVVFPDDEATFIPLSTLEPARLTVLPRQFDDYEFADDENAATIWYIVQPSGDLYILEPAVRKLWSFARGTWIRSSDSGDAYLAIVPGPKGRGMGDAVTIWSGKATGDPPMQLGAMRACEPGDDRGEDAQVTDDGRVAVVKRCGAMSVFAGGGVREIENAERVSLFRLSADGRWLALGRAGAIELVDLDTGATRTLAGAATIAAVGFSPNVKWVYSVGGEQGTRVWSVVGARNDRVIGKLGDTADRATSTTIRGCGRWRSRPMGARACSRVSTVPRS